MSTNTYFEDQAKRTQEFYNAEAEREAKFFAEELRKSGEFAQGERQMAEERVRLAANQQQLQNEAKAWGRNDLAESVKAGLGVGDRVQADFPKTNVDLSHEPVLSSSAEMFDGSQSAEVEISAVVSLSQSDFDLDFATNDPKPYLQSEAGKTQDGLDKAVLIQVAKQEPFLVVPNAQGQISSVGFKPQPAVIQAQQAPQQSQQAAPKVDHSLNPFGKTLVQVLVPLCD